MDMGISNSNVRMENRKRLTRLLYKFKDGLTKQNISAILHLSLPTVNTLIAQLEEDNLITRQSSALSSGGRIPDLICFRSDAYYSVALELEPEGVRAAVVNLHCQSRGSRTLPLPFDNTPVYWDKLYCQVLGLLEELQIDTDLVVGIGMSIPGVVDAENQIIKRSPSLGLRNFNMEAAVGAWSFPVLVENSCNTAGYGEIWFQEDLEDGVYLSVGSQIQGAIIARKQLVRGSHHCTGNFGHMILMPHGNRCSCGKQGCFDAYCSTDLLARHGEGSIESFFRQKLDDEALQQVWEDYLNYLAIGISNLCVALDFPVILGGRLGEHLKPDFYRLKSIVDSLTPSQQKKPILRLGGMGRDAAGFGAALMMIIRYLDIL